MDSTEYNPEKKAIPITGIILSLIGLIGVVVYFVLDLCTTIFTTPIAITYLVIDFVFIIAGIICAAVAKKKKYGSKSLANAAELISVIVVAVYAIGNFISIMIK